MRWSQLKQLLGEILLPEVELHCSSYRRADAPPLGRYWLHFDGVFLWQAPHDFEELRRTGGPNTDATAVGLILREYLQLARGELVTPFDPDPFGLRALLRACDRRIGSRRLPTLEQLIGGYPHTAPAREVIQFRLGREG